MPIKRPPEIGARQAQSGAKERVHIAITKKWLRMIERAARRKNLGRSNFIAQAAHAAAVAELATEEVTNGD